MYEYEDKTLAALNRLANAAEKIASSTERIASSLESLVKNSDEEEKGGRNFIPPHKRHLK